MAITIVSALTKSIPAPAADATASAEDSGSALDFASLLFGQLVEALPLAGSSTAPAPELAVGEIGDAEQDDESTLPGDPLALLAALAQAPVEQRSAAAPGISLKANDTSLAQEAPPPATDSTSAGRGITAGNSAQKIEMAATPPALPASAPMAEESEPAAKFAAAPAAAAVFRATAPTEGASARSEPAEIPAAATNDTQPAAIAGNPVAVPGGRDTPATLSVPTPLRDRDWNNDFAQKVVWIATSHKQGAELTLNPPAMGNIEISLQLDKDKATATATFVSTNAEVRETIETALPRLREMLAGVGIELGQTNVSAESFRQASGNENATGNASQSRSDKAILAPDSQAAQAASRILARVGRGLVDTFA